MKKQQHALNQHSPLGEQNLAGATPPMGRSPRSDQPEPENRSGFAHRELEKRYRLERRQVQGWTIASICAAVTGLCLVAWTVAGVLLYRVQASPAIGILFTVVVAAVTSLFLVQAKKANERMDASRADLVEARELEALEGTLQRIEESSVRDTLRAEMIRRLLDRRDRVLFGCGDRPPLS